MKNKEGDLPLYLYYHHPGVEIKVVVERTYEGLFEP